MDIHGWLWFPTPNAATGASRAVHWATQRSAPHVVCLVFRVETSSWSEGAPQETMKSLENDPRWKWGKFKVRRIICRMNICDFFCLMCCLSIWSNLIPGLPFSCSAGVSWIIWMWIAGSQDQRPDPATGTLNARKVQLERFVESGGPPSGVTTRRQDTCGQLHDCIQWVKNPKPMVSEGEKDRIWNKHVGNCPSWAVVGSPIVRWVMSEKVHFFVHLELLESLSAASHKAFSHVCLDLFQLMRRNAQGKHGWSPLQPVWTVAFWTEDHHRRKETSITTMLKHQTGCYNLYMHMYKYDISYPSDVAWLYEHHHVQLFVHYAPQFLLHQHASWAFHQFHSITRYRMLTLTNLQCKWLVVALWWPYVQPTNSTLVGGFNPSEKY